MSQTLTGDQASGQSLEDRIAAQFGLDEETEPQEQQAPQEAAADEEVSEAPAEPEEVEIEYEGERFRLPKKLEKGFMQERDYTRKTQELSEQRKRLEQAESSLKLAQIERDFDSAVADDRQQLSVIDNYVKNLKAQNFNDMTAEDGFKQWMQIQQLQERRKELESQIESKRTDYKRKYDETISELKGKTRDALSKLIPSFSDEAMRSLEDYAQAQGYTKGDFERITLDAKSTALLWKAQRFDQLQAEKANAVKKVETPTLKPGSSTPMPQAVKDKLALRKAFASAKTKQEREAINFKRVEALF